MGSPIPVSLCTTNKGAERLHSRQASLALLRRPLCLPQAKAMELGWESPARGSGAGLGRLYSARPCAADPGRWRLA